MQGQRTWRNAGDHHDTVPSLEERISSIFEHLPLATSHQLLRTTLRLSWNQPHCRYRCVIMNTRITCEEFIFGYQSLQMNPHISQSQAFPGTEKLAHTTHDPRAFFFLPFRNCVLGISRSPTHDEARPNVCERGVEMDRQWSSMDKCCVRGTTGRLVENRLDEW
jgi:hypothetical protein